MLEEISYRHKSVQTSGFTPESFKPGLESMLEFDRITGACSEAFRSIHVAGTNGKGSVCSMLASSLQASGYRTGLYTSPHLLDFRERIKIVSDGSFEMIPKEDVWEFLSTYKKDIDGLDLSFFEVTTGMAFWWFARQQVDMAVVETGLGGRLDSTNILTPELSIVTSIGLDHCAILGNTIQEIAAEKAGIFKSGTPALVGEYDGDTADVFAAKAAQVHCPLFFADEMPVEECDPSALDLKGEYQGKNLRTTLCALEILGEDPDMEGICRAAQVTGLRGRWEKVLLGDGEGPAEAIMDIGHNPPALKENFRQLEGMARSGKYDKLIMVYGVMADKALDDIIPLMPGVEAFPLPVEYVFVTPSTPRAMPAEEIMRRFVAATPGKEGLTCSVVQSFSEIFEKKFKEANSRTIIYIGGSTFVVSDFLRENEAQRGKGR